jgi:hypothetical protein
MDESALSARTFRFTGLMAMVAALATALAGIFYVLLPAAQRLGVPGRELLPSFAANPLPLQMETIALGAMGIVGLALVRPITALAGGTNDWLRWTSILALVGYGVAAVGNTLVLGKLPGIAAAFVAADPSMQPVIATFWRTTLDPFGLWQFGAVGIWLIVVGLVAMRTRGWPSIGAYLALAAGVAHLAIPVVLLVAAQSALGILALVAAAVIVIWFGWLGLHLMRLSGVASTT